MLESIAALFAGTTGASVIGLAGGLVSGVLEYKKSKNELEFKKADISSQRAHELALAAHELEVAKQSASLQLTLGEQSAQREIEDHSFQSQMASYAHDGVSYSKGSNNPWLIAVDVFRGFIRPVITVGLELSVVILAAALTYLCWDLLVTTYAKDGVDILRETYADIRYMAVTTTLWWFGGRLGNQVGNKK